LARKPVVENLKSKIVLLSGPRQVGKITVPQSLGPLPCFQVLAKASRVKSSPEVELISAAHFLEKIEKIRTQ